MTATDAKTPARHFHVHSPSPLSVVADKELAHRLRHAYWTIGEAIFLMQGYEPPPEEFAHNHLIDHFYNQYDLAKRQIEFEHIECKRRSRAGQNRIVASPKDWISLAPRLGIQLDPRIAQKLQVLEDGMPQSTEPKPRAEARKAETQRRDYELQCDANELFASWTRAGRLFNKKALAYELEFAKGKNYSGMTQERILKIIRLPKA